MTIELPILRPLCGAVPTYGLVRRTITQAFPTDNSATAIEVAKVETTLNGLTSYATRFGLIASATRPVPVAGAWTVTETAPDGLQTISTYQNGRLATVTRRDATGQLSQTTYAYDPHGRLASATDARNGPTTFTYDAADQRISVTKQWGRVYIVDY